MVKFDRTPAFSALFAFSASKNAENANSANLIFDNL